MLVKECKFDPVRDMHPVEQYGFIDLKTALDSSIVPSQLPDSDSDYNGIEDPQKILGKPRDVFDAIDSQKALEASSSGQDSGDGDKNE